MLDPDKKIYEWTVYRLVCDVCGKVHLMEDYDGSGFVANLSKSGWSVSLVNFVPTCGKCRSQQITQKVEDLKDEP